MSKEVAKDKSVITQEQPGETNLLTRILDEGRLARNEIQAEQAKDMIAEFVQQVMQGQMTVSKDMESTINARIAAIDKLLSAQLNEIMHKEEFQKLEASWRGLHHLVMNSETGTMLKIRVLNVSKKDLLKDLERAAEFDQSALFKKVYEEEFGTFGGAPYGALIGDYEFSNHPQDIALLEKISNVAAAANAPFVAAASPQLFGWDNYQDLTEVRDLAKIFDRTEFAKWRSFRESEDSRYV
ncbi:MAG TPA: type VI secretion system contractile sheath large subunit, partial [Pyrinomonadaceae bacterium]|nr:type VI secretion system contractile sheath large subunit [Pyrinomonadaceae bacterium]